MKKTWIAILALSAAFSAFSQGQVNFDTHVGTSVDARFFYFPGGNFFADGFGQLLIANSDQSLAPLLPIGVLGSSGPEAGYINAGTATAPAGYPGGTTVHMILRVWNGGPGSTYDTSALRVQSAPFLITLTESPDKPSDLIGLQGATLVPEPTTLALGTAGLGLFLLRLQNSKRLAARAIKRRSQVVKNQWIAFLVVAGNLTGLAQGQVNFNTHVGASVDARILSTWPDFPNVTPVTDGFGELFIASGTGSFVPLTPIAPFRTTQRGAGYINAGAATAPAGFPGGTIVNLVLRAWLGGPGSTFDNSPWRGQTAAISVTLEEAPNIPNDLVGLQGFSFLPEPTSLALSALGICALLFRRRR